MRLNNRVTMCFMVVLFQITTYAFSETPVISEAEQKEESELEQLWDLCRANNLDIVKLNQAVSEQRISRKYIGSVYSPNVTMSISPDFTNAWDGVSEYPSGIGSSLSLTKPFPGGTSVSADLSYTMSRTLYEMSQEPDDSNVTYYHTPSMTLSLSQSLFPYWAQGEKQDPEKRLLDLSVQRSEEQRLNGQEVAIKALTDCYIQIRHVLREISVYTKILSYYDMRIEAFYEYAKTGAIDISTVWIEEEARRDYADDYYTAQETLVDLVSLLHIYCGLTNKHDANLVSVETSLPLSGTIVSRYDHEYEAIQIEEEQIQVQMVQTKQALAPKVTLSGTVSATPDLHGKEDDYLYIWNKNKTWNWSITLMFDISSLFSPELEQAYKLSKLKLESLETSKDVLDIQKKRKLNFYIKKLELYVERKEFIEKQEKNWWQKQQDLQKMFENGAASTLDVESAYMQAYLKSNELADIEDQIWYYSWMKNNIGQRALIMRDSVESSSQFGY